MVTALLYEAVSYKFENGGYLQFIISLHLWTSVLVDKLDLFGCLCVVVLTSLLDCVVKPMSSTQTHMYV